MQRHADVVDLRRPVRRGRSLWALVCAVVFAAAPAGAQELGGAGTIQGVVRDPTGGVMVAVAATLKNTVSGFTRTASTDQSGRFVLRNIPPNTYQLTVDAQGFQPMVREVDVRSAVPITLDLTLQLAVETSTVQVVGHAEALVERDPTAHVDIDQSLVKKLPIEGTSGLNQIVTLASPGVVADANGFFHPIGDHAQTQFSIDNQPVTDQQSKIYSNQISPDAVQSMEIITGVPPAEFGEKDSLVVRIVTKSGLDQPKPTGAATVGYGSFRAPAADVNLGMGGHHVGNFASIAGLRTDRYLDPPEFEALHGQGHNGSVFDRMDVRPTDVDTIHVNVQFAKSSFDVPNTYDQAALGQAQHQSITTFNIAPGYTRILSSSLLLAANAFARRDHVVYTPSPDPFSDSPGTVSQDRQLTNIGAKVDVSYVNGAHNVKFGGAFAHTPLDENFTLGLTDPGANSPCVTADGVPVGDPALVSPSQCAAPGYEPNADFLPGLVPYDLSRGGGLYRFAAKKPIDQQAFYVQDEIKVAQATIKAGLRLDHYDGLTTRTLAQPRVGVSYALPAAGTILRASYGRTLETPYNENLLLSSTADPAIFGTSGEPLSAGTRDQVEVGVQQGLGAWVVVDVGYFRKRTTNAYDFGVLFDTPIFFPVSWDHSKIDGITARVTLVEHRGLSAFTVMGHTNAIFSPPGTGGLLLETPEGPFRIDHDQRFQQTTNVQYVFDRAHGVWAALVWRYDSGLVAGSVPDYGTALTLTGDQQSAIGLYCGSTFATVDMPLTACDSTTRGATRLRIPADGTADDLNNPPRIAPRHLFDLGLGVDNLLGTERAKVKVQFTVVNLGDTVALYNFLSTFSGTHFVTPRAYQVRLGVSF